MMSTKSKLLLHLSLIQDIGPATAEKLVQAFFHPDLSSRSLTDLYYFTSDDIVYYASISRAVGLKITQGLKNTKLLEQELALLKQHNIQVITLFDEHYPNLLRAIYLPPLVLYVSGAGLEQHAKTLALVGSRQADQYGSKIVQTLVPELIAHDWTLASGGALGIDTLVHKATLAFGGKTIAVLGSGLLKPYPASNKQLFAAIIQNGGTIVSPFSLNTSALPGNFPARNRIISGLSQGCIVIQAACPSGALITANYALEQGREVAAVPGPIDNPLSAGCHKLISQGALLVSCAQDILKVVSPEKKKEVTTKQEFMQKPERKEVQLKVPIAPEELIFIHTQKPISFDELLGLLQLEESALQELLFQLQINGRITQNFMGLWQAL